MGCEKSRRARGALVAGSGKNCRWFFAATFEGGKNMLELAVRKESHLEGENFVQRKAGKCILVIEDDAALRQSLAEQLQLHEEFEVDEAADGAEALRAVKQGHHDLILLDVHLPDMDGREVCKLIRRSGVLTPVIMLTSVTSMDTVTESIGYGATDYVAKPFTIKKLLGTIEKYTVHAAEGASAEEE